MLIETFVASDPYDLNWFWLSLTVAQIGLSVSTIILLYRASPKYALFAVIIVVLIEIVLMIPFTISELASYPEVNNLAWVGVPVIGLLVIDYNWDSSFTLFKYWFVDLSYAGTLISLIFLVLLVIKGSNFNEPFIQDETSCPHFSANKQKRNFCSNCGEKI
jgi:hypothetical protein